MRLTLLVLGACIVSLAQPAAAQTCNEKCVQQFDPDRNPIGWACHTTGTNKNCVATTTQCSITIAEAREAPGCTPASPRLTVVCSRFSRSAM